MTEARHPRQRAAAKRNTRPGAKQATVKPITVSPARQAAFSTLEQVARGTAHSDDLLHGPAVGALSPQDRNLATALVLGVLRWQIALDASVRPYLQRPDVQPALGVLLALRLGAFQLLHMDRIPTHAALSESVELAKTSGNAHAAGMVNAVLRKVASAPVPGKRLHESVAGFAERLGHPAWMVERWAAAYGRAAALAICEFDQREPGCGELFAEEASGVDAADEANRWPPLMDDGSRLVAELAAIAMPQARRIWDCCAAPGGKTLVLAHRLLGESSNESATELLATDSNARRLEGLSRRLRGLPGTRTLLADAAALPSQEGEFDLILCDVPCSGTGTLARNPEIRHRLQASEFARQAERQRSILAAALKRLRSGGRLVYSTCSLEPEENEQVLRDVLQGAGKGLVVLPMEPFIERLRESRIVVARADLSKAVRDGLLRTLPGYGSDCDGFFAAVIERQ